MQSEIYIKHLFVIILIIMAYKLMKTFSQYSNFEVHQIIKIITNKGLKYLTLHVTSLYNILVSPFTLN